MAAHVTGEEGGNHLWIVLGNRILAKSVAWSMNPRGIAVLLALVVVGTACRSADISGAVEAGDLLEFPGIEALAAEFNADAGMPRLILSLSPT